MSSAQLTLWLQDSPASPHHTQVSAVVQAMIDGSGRTYTGSFNPRGPLGSCLRTFLASSAWDSIPFSAIWTARATKQRRVYIRLQRLGRHTNGSGSSSWPTPSAQEPGWQNITIVDKDGNPPTHHEQRWYDATTGRLVQKGLTQVVEKMWPTPDARDSQAGGLAAEQRRYERYSTIGLEAATKLWPTPTSTAGDGRSEQSIETWTARAERTLVEKGIHNGLPLNVAVQMASARPTPQARDYRSGDQPGSHRAMRKQEQGRTPDLNDAVHGKLNPDWVELLQGFPPGWTDIPAGPPDPVKRNTRMSRRARSRAGKRTEPAA